MSTNDRRAKLEEIIALNTERHNRLQEEEDFEAYYRENILLALDDIVRQVASERAPETSTATGLGQKVRISTTMRDFFARFDDTYQSLMEAMFPPVCAMTVGGGTRSVTEGTGATGAMAPKDSSELIAPTPTREEVRARLPAWVVVPYADTLWPGSEFAILWTGEGKAPALPLPELRLDGQPQGEDVFKTWGETDAVGLPTGKVTFVQLKKELKPKAFTIVEGEDGRLVIDFMT